MLCLLFGCGGRAARANGAPAPGGVVIIATLPLQQLFVLEASGTPPSDTVVVFRAGTPRTIVMRHAPPDNTVFAELEFPAQLFANSGRDSIRVTIHPRPGVYGIDVTSEVEFGAGARLTFKYPVHFSAPAAARARYGSTAAFERALFIGRLTGDNLYALIKSDRPASDNLEGPLPAPGTYLVAAPK